MQPRYFASVSDMCSASASGWEMLNAPKSDSRMAAPGGASERSSTHEMKRRLTKRPCVYFWIHT